MASSGQVNEWPAGADRDAPLRQGLRIPGGPLYSPLQTLQDPQVQQTGMLEWVDYPGLPGPAPLASHPVEFTALEAKIRMRAPTLGEHTVEVLHSIGYGDDQIAELRRKRVV